MLALVHSTALSTLLLVFKVAYVVADALFKPLKLSSFRRQSSLSIEFICMVVGRRG